MAIRGLFASHSGIVGDRRRDDFASRILMNEFAGTAPMLAMSAGMPKDNIRNTEFSWVEDSHISGNAELTANHDNAVTAIAVDDTNLWIVGSIIINQSTGEHMLITAIAGTTVTVVRGFTNTTAAAGTTGDKVQMIGTAFAEGSDGAESVMQVGESRTNYVQIFKAAYGVTGTANAVEYQSGNKMAESKGQARTQLAEQIERSFMFGRPGVLSQGQKVLRLSAGIDYSIRQYGGLVESANDNATAGRLNIYTLQNFLRRVFDRSIKGQPNERISFTSSHVIELIQRMVMDLGEYSINVRETAFGIRVVELITPNGTIKMLTHPMFIENDAWALQLWVLHPAGIRRKILRDVMVVDQTQQNQANAKDIESGHLLTELGFEVKGVQTMGMITNIQTAGGVGALPTT